MRRIKKKTNKTSEFFFDKTHKVVLMLRITQGVSREGIMKKKKKMENIQPA